MIAAAPFEVSPFASQPVPQTNNPRCVLSLFDYSGVWSAPYAEAGHYVVQVDIKHFIDAMDLDCEWLIEEVMDNSPTGTVDGILAAPPCTDFAVSGAQYWSAKDADGRTERSLELVRQVLRAVEFCKPDWWSMENPVGRLNKCIPGLSEFGPWYWQPHHYGDAYTKKTGLWGRFYKDLPRCDVEPVRACDQGSWLQRLGGTSERTKELRSLTPPGFAWAFFMANSWQSDRPAATAADFPELHEEDER